MKSLKWSILGPEFIAKDFAIPLKEVSVEIYEAGFRAYNSAEDSANQFNNIIALAKWMKSEDNGVYPMVN
ncbi:hypothetical protein JHL18_01815 [Clostridium sp. YIM B02505]|uniref:Uncharacterized protein n=1 Tax=Clostridium yunnanense TaxID=2800325 RepID=A0ABS1EJ87_9CLOT|nr:hypothetical protein [Clostridium yunnanense]MBK1809383.1 hypothetical protein [Clostridium yunnanense]